MKTMKSRAFAALSALAIALVFQVPITPVVAEDNGARDDSRKLHLRVYFERFAGPAVPDFGDQFTIGGTVARFESPNQRIGTFAIHFVATAPFAAETLLYGVLNLPDGQIWFTGLSPTQEPRIPGPITGGTGEFKSARGQVDHVSLPGGVEELILTFNGN